MTIRPIAKKRTTAALLSIGLFGLLPHPAWGQGGLENARQKAVFVRNILSFVQWQADPASGKHDALQLCVEEDTILGFALAEEFRGLTLDDRKVDVRSTHGERDWQGCRVLLFGVMNQNKMGKLLAAAGPKRLTIGQTNQFMEAGGAIQFGKAPSGLEFEVNLQAARDAGALMDARLLRLARRVVNGGTLAGG